jgi:hypothetical protein
VGAQVAMSARIWASADRLASAGWVFSFAGVITGESGKGGLAGAIDESLQSNPPWSQVCTQG